MLLRGPVTYYPAEGKRTAGEVHLTGEKLTFTPKTSATEPGEPLLELTLEQITTARRTGIATRITVQASSKGYAFGGPTAVALYAWLLGLRGVRAADDEPPAQPVESFVAALCRGPLRPSGRGVVTSQRLVFVPNSVWDRWFGGTEIVAELAQLSSLGVDERHPSRLRVAIGEKRYTFAVTQPATRLTTWVAGIRRHESEAEFDGPLEEKVGEVLQPRKVRLWGDEKVEQLRSVIWWRTDQQVQRAWFVLTDARLLIVPHDTAVAPLVCDLDQAHLDDDEDPSAADDEQDLRLLVKGKPVHLTTLGDPLSPELFQQRARHSTPPAEQAGPNLDRLLGAARYVGLFQEDTAVARVTSNAALERHSDVEGLTLAGVKPDQLPANTKVLVDIERDYGFFRFDTEVLENPAQEPDGTWPAGAWLLVAIPNRIRSFNRRDSFRQTFDQPLKLRIVKTAKGKTPRSGRRLTGRLDNLSTGGCAVDTTTPIEAGAMLTVALVDDQGELELTAECLRADNIRPKSRKPLFRNGLAFRELAERTRDRIHRMVLDRERQLRH